ncbi:hypothetical protein FGADI_3094 [Fusarium gaditjirri]|uniref:Hsp70 protein n=1 Tax=Fusarium gaditjirri TaxID=282569 RepID=A0A8H4TGG9_9HYPO|nr:hypothetical protein FGADI_3094 [Fusarium gaditjirri]
MEADLTIRKKTRFCKEEFQRCLKIQDLAADDWLEQKSAEFNWWVSGLNADKIGPGSLDSRLMLRPDVRDVVADLLDGLITALSKCEDIAEEDIAEVDSLEEPFSSSQYLTANGLNRTPSPWSDMSDGTGTEANCSTKDENDDAVGDLYREQKFYIETNIEILIRIHAAIKKSGLKFRNQRADDALKRAEERYQLEKSHLGEHEALYGSDSSIGEHERFRRFLTRLVLQNGYKEQLLRSIESNIQRFITEHGSEIDDNPYLNCQRKLLLVLRAWLYDPSRLTPIQRRLINANVVRRNRLIHAGNARKAQSATKQDEPQLPHRLPITKEETQQSQVEERKLDQSGQMPATKPSYTPPVPAPTSKKSFVSQTATGLASNFSLTTALVPTKKTKSAATKMSARVATIDYPKCPAKKGPLPCPYCPSILSHAYTERNKWRAHVAQDLCAYVCIFEDCKSPDDMYTSTYEWMSHMARDHSATEWVCTECSKQDPPTVENASIHFFDDSLDLEAHILSLHPEIHESEVNLMVDAGKRPVGIQRVACPLCRPGLVSNPSEEEDGTAFHPESLVEEIGLVHLEEDEHIATHIHEFSLQAFPWPSETKVQDKSGMSISHSTASTRQEITFQGSGDADPIFEIQNYLHNHVEDGGDPFPKRLIIAVDFGTTYSAVSYVEVPQGHASGSVDPRSIRSIENYPQNYHPYKSSMYIKVPTEVIYPLDRHFRDHFNLDSSEGRWKTGDSIGSVTDEDDDIAMFSDVLKKFRWGYQVHEVWNRPSTHSNTTNQPLSRFKLLLDNSEMTESVRRGVTDTISTLKKENVIQRPLHVIADFLTYLLGYTQSELLRQGFDDSYEREMVLCVPTMWTQKACRDMQACLAVAMKRANFTRTDLQNKSIDNLFIVSEPEAAAAHMLSTSAEIKAGDCFVLLDAGGGIVDANTYRVSRELPLRLETEIVAPGGGLHGSSYLNEDFRAYLEDLLAEETYLDDGIDTIHGLVERITFEDFEIMIKPGFDYRMTTSSREIYIRGLRDNPAKGFRNECIYIPSLKIREIFFKQLDAIVEILESQLEGARKEGCTVGKVVLVGGFGTSNSLRERIRGFLEEYGREHNCRVTLMEPQQGTPMNSVASGAVLRALNKENGPERIARLSYGILRTEPFGQFLEHAGLKPSYDHHDGMPYIKDTIDWVLKLVSRYVEALHLLQNQLKHREREFHQYGSVSPSPAAIHSTSGLSAPLSAKRYSTYQTARQNRIIAKLIPITKVSLRILMEYISNWILEGAEYVGEIEVDFSSLRDQLVPIEPIVDNYQQNVGEKHYRIDFMVAIRVVDRNLECFAIHDQNVVQKCRINIAPSFRPEVE